MIKVITAPLWLPFWLIAKFFQARATVRSGQRYRRVRL